MSRADRLAATVGEKGLDALLITNLPNLRWATRLLFCAPSARLMEVGMPRSDAIAGARQTQESGSAPSLRATKCVVPRNELPG